MKPGDRVLIETWDGWEILTASEHLEPHVIEEVYGRLRGIVADPENEARLLYALQSADKDFAEGMRLAKQARDARYRIAIEKWCKGETE